MGLFAQAYGGGSSPSSLSFRPPQLPATPAPEKPSVLGFLGNLVGDVGEMAGGISSLAVSGLHDLGVAGANLIPGEQEIEKGGYRLDDIAKALPSAIIGDYKSRYGFEGADEVKNQLYENPLSYILDIASVASAGVKGAELAGQAALKGTEAAEIAAQATKELGAAGVASRTAKAAGIESGLSSAISAGENVGSLGTLAAKILPKATGKFVEGKGIVASAEIRNPLYRALAAPAKRLTTHPLGTLEESLASLQSKMATTLKPALEGGLGREVAGNVTADVSYLSDLLTDAKARGMTRIERPQIARFNAKKAATKTLIESGAAHIMKRNKMGRVYQEAIIHEIGEDPAVRDLISSTATGLNAKIPGYTSAEWAARQGMDELEGPELRIADQAAEFTGDQMAPDELMHAAQINEPFTKRTDAVVNQLVQFNERLATETDTLMKLNPTLDIPAEVMGTRRLVRGLQDGLRRRVAFEDGTIPVDPTVRATDNLRLLDVEHKIDEINHLIDTPKHMLERSYYPLRAKYEDMGEIPDVAVLDDAMREAGAPQPTYFPYIDEERAKPSDFFRSRQTRGANIYAKDPHNKQLKGVLLREGTYIHDPIEAYTRRSAIAARESETYNTMSAVVRDTGREIESAEELPTGWVAVAPDAMFLVHRTRMKFLDEIDRLKTAGMDSDNALARVVEDVTMKNQDDVTKLFGTTLGHPGAPKMYAVPKVVADQMGAAAKWASLGGTNTRLFYDTAMNAWRGLALTASPRWVVNNVIGNTIFAAMQGVKTMDVLRVLGERFRAMAAGWFESKDSEIMQGLGKVLGGGELREGSLAGQIQRLPGAEEIGQGWAGSALEQYHPQLGPQAAETTTGQIIQKAQASRPLTRIRKMGDAVKHLNAEIEMAYRDASYLTAAEKQIGKNALQRTGRTFWRSKQRIENIMASGFDESSGKVAAALQDTNYFFGNYGNMSPFERHVVRRFIFPFWGFYRHQLNLLLRFPMDYPGRAAVMNQLEGVTNELQEEYGPVPEWLEGAIPLSPPGGDVSFLTTRGPNPFAGTFEPPTSMLSPALKIILEQSLGRNLFTGKQYTDENVVTPYGSDQGYRIEYGEDGQPIDAQPEDRTAPGILEHILQQVPQYNMAKDAIAGGQTYDTATLASVLQGEGTVRDDQTGAPAYPTSAIQQLLKLSGISVVPYDLAGYQDTLATERETALKRAMDLYQQSQALG